MSKDNTRTEKVKSKNGDKYLLQLINTNSIWSNHWELKITGINDLTLKLWDYILDPERTYADIVFNSVKTRLETEEFAKVKTYAEELCEEFEKTIKRMKEETLRQLKRAA
jgi:cyclopropane fatty-acyl-phospholipid synthase-like methyltransferase